MRTKLFTLLFAMLVGTCSLFAYDVKIGDLYYNLNAENKTAEVTYIWNNSQWGYNYGWTITTADIPASIIYYGNSYSVTSIGDHAFSNQEKLTSITIPNSVTSIGSYAFSSCSGLTSIDIPNSVTSIGDYAFYGCTGLTSITIPNSVTSIGNGAFYGCTGLTLIDIPNSVTSIGGKAFYNCIGLTLIDIPNSVTSIGNSAFCSCEGLTSIEIPNSVTSIGDSTFIYCSGLTSITIGNSVTSIGKRAFYYCSSLSSIEIPNSVTSIGDYAFSGCTSLPVIDNIRYADTYLVDVVDKTLSSYTIKDGTRWIGTFAFQDCTGLTSVTIPNSVTSIGDRAFWYCTGLTSVTIPNSISSIGEWTFGGCTSLTSVFWNAKNCNACNFGNQVESFTFGDNVEVIPAFLCANMEKLTSITIPKSVTYLGEGAFKNCTNISSVTIHDGLDSIRNSTFMWCSLTSFTIPNSVTYIGEKAFYGTILTSITIPQNIKNIGKDAFTTNGESKLNSVMWNAIDGNAASSSFPKTITSFIFGDSVKNIRSNICTNLDKIESLTIPKNVEWIAYNAFSGCTGLKSIIWNAKKCDGYNFGSQVESFTFGNIVEVIPASICSGMEKLTSIEIPISATSIGNSSFSGCTNLTSITIPNSIKWIGDYAFYNCGGLRTVNMSDQVQSIGAHSFENCTRVNTINLPNTLTYIGTDAFKNTPFFASAGEWENGIRYINTCIVETNPNEVPSNPVIREGTTAFMPTAFANCQKIESLSLPAGIKIIPDSAFLRCTNLNAINISKDITFIGKYAFKLCEKLTAIIIPENVTSIEDGTFESCYRLTSIEIPNSVTSIGDRTFYSCSNLKTITLGENIQEIGNDVFAGCDNIENVQWNIRNMENLYSETTGMTLYFEKPEEWSDLYLWAWESSNENIFNKWPGIKLTPKDDGLYSYDFGDRGRVGIVLSDGNGVQTEDMYIYSSQYIVPIKRSYGKWDCKRYITHLFPKPQNIKSFTFGKNVEKIPALLCMDMSSLSSISIPESVTEISIGAFAHCKAITEIDIPDGVIEISDLAFADNDALTSVIIPNNVNYLGKKAFSGCSSLKEITLGHAIESIGDNAFDKCPNVMTIYSYLETPPAINSTVFAGFGTYKGVDLYIPEGAKANYEAMDYWKDFYIIEGLPDIIDNKLHYTLNEETQTATLITSSLAELKPVIDGELIIPDTVVSNGKTYVVTAIGNNVFKDNSTITTVVIPSSVTQIGDSAFYGSSITSVVIGGTEVPAPNNTATRRIVSEGICCSIGAYAFANCKKLTEINFPECVSAIGEGAFKDCSALTTINSKMQNPPIIDETVFEGCGDLGNITLMVPEGSEETYKNMAVWKEFLLNTSLKTYTITFVNWDGAELLKLAEVQEGTLPVYTAELPTRPEDDEFTYSFIGWTPEIVPASEDATYTAAYEATPKAEGIKDVFIDNIVTQKLLRDGQILILRGDKTYTLTGQEVK